MNEEKDYQALVEDYEDALMRLVMYRAAQADGKRLLEEAEELENSGFQVPPELDEKCMKLIACASQERRQAPAREGGRFGVRQAARLVVVAMFAALFLFCTAYAVNEDFRVSVLNFIMDIQEDGTRFFFGPSGSGDASPNSFSTEEDFPFEFTYIPEGYELLTQEVNDFGDGEVYYYRIYSAAEDPPHEFYFDIRPIFEGSGRFVDTEDAVVTEITIHGHDGWLIVKTDATSQREKIKYLWFDLVNRHAFLYSSVGISQEESQKIFDGIVIDEAGL